MNTLSKRMLLISLMALSSILVSGCFLQLFFGTVGQRDEDFTIVAIFEIGWNSATCREETDGDSTFIECTYVILGEGEVEVTSSAELISKFGILGVFLDPVILQVPEDATGFGGTFNAPGETPRPIEVTEVDSFEAQPGVPVLPEAGQKFVILDFTDDVHASLPAGDPRNGDPFEANFSFELTEFDHLQAKGMFAGKVEIGGETYYPPMLPCTTDFSSIPSITVPATGFMDNLAFQVQNAVLPPNDLACNGQVYDFTGAGAGTPAIDIEKSPATQDVDFGSNAVFDIRITNSGDVDLSGVEVSDPLTSDCDRTIGDLAAGATESYSCTATGVTDDFVNVASVTGIAPTGGVTDQDSASVTVLAPPANLPPDCSTAASGTGLIWPPNHKFVTVGVTGITDPDGDNVSVVIDGIWQDEPVNATGDGNFAPDGTGVGTSTAYVRAERAGGGNGRVYHIMFTADDGQGGTCSGEVTVGVPHDMGRGRTPVDDGPLFDSTGS